MKNMKKVLCLLMATVLLSLVTLGCGNNDDTNSSTLETGAASGTEQSGNAGNTQNDTTEPGTSSRDTVVVVQNDAPVRFCFLGDTQSNMARDMISLNNVNDCILKLNADGTISPNLATSVDAAEDGMSYTIHLRDDVTFHNGYKMTAEDVVFSMNKLIELDVTAARALLTNMDHAEVVDDYTVKIVMSSPFAAFMNCLTARGAYVYSKAYYEELGEDGYAYDAAPIGVGPYKYVKQDVDGTLYLEAYEDYWKGTPAIKNVIVRNISNNTTKYLALENGEVDVVLDADISSCLKFGDGLDWSWCNSAATAKMDIVCWDDRITSDINLRKAIQAAINKEDILIAVLEGYGEVADVFTNLSYTGVPDISTMEMVEYDPEKAKEYLADSNYDGTPLICVVTEGTQPASAAVIIQNQLLAVGINMEIQAVDANTANSMTRDSKANDFHLSVSVTTASLFDSQILNSNFSSVSMERGYPRQDELDQLIVDQAKETNTDVREKIVGQINDILTEEVYTVPLYYGAYAVAYQDDMVGVTPHPLYLISFYDWSVK